MSVPFNDIDYARFLKLAKLIKEHANEKTHMNIYTSDGYVHLEFNAHNLPIAKVREVFDTQLTADQIADIEKLVEPQ